MIKKNIQDVEEEIVTKANSKNTKVRWMITKEDGVTHFATRRFEIKIGGEVGLHEHPEEHHAYILQGEAEFFNEKGVEFKAKKDDTIYISPNEVHGIRNISEESFIFICIIPYLD